MVPTGCLERFSSNESFQLTSISSVFSNITKDYLTSESRKLNTEKVHLTLLFHISWHLDSQMGNGGIVAASSSGKCLFIATQGKYLASRLFYILSSAQPSVMEFMQHGCSSKQFPPECLSVEPLHVQTGHWLQPLSIEISIVSLNPGMQLKSSNMWHLQLRIILIKSDICRNELGWILFGIAAAEAMQH